MHHRTVGDAVSAAAIPLDDEFSQGSDNRYLDIELAVAADECMLACLNAMHPRKWTRLLTGWWWSAFR